MAPIFAIYLVWAAWIVTWFAVAPRNGATTKPAGALPRALYWATAIVGFFLLFGFYSNRYDMIYRFWRTLNGVLGWTMLVLVVAGFAFTWWARGQLGPLWPSEQSRKGGHHVIDSGPYALVRHPVFTGLTLAAVATAIAHGTPSSFLGAALMTAGWYLKARTEERLLREELGPEVYDAYASRVPMLVPFLHKHSESSARAS